MLEGELRVTKFFGEQEIFLGTGFRESSSARFKSCWTSRICARSGGRRQPAFSSATRRILGPATQLAYGGEGNHANAGDAIAQYGRLHTGAREAHPTWRDGSRACP